MNADPKQIAHDCACRAREAAAWSECHRWQRLFSRAVLGWCVTLIALLAVVAVAIARCAQ